MASLSSSYNKWDRLEVSDDEDAGSKRPDQAERFAAHRQGMSLVAQWVGEAAAAHGASAPAGEDLRLLLDFVAAQCASPFATRCGCRQSCLCTTGCSAARSATHALPLPHAAGVCPACPAWNPIPPPSPGRHRGVRPDNRCRANDVIALVASRGEPRVADLVRLSELARDRTREGGGAAGGGGGSGNTDGREQAGRVLQVSMGALNTLAAIAAFGGGEKGAPHCLMPCVYFLDHPIAAPPFFLSFFLSGRQSGRTASLPCNRRFRPQPGDHPAPTFACRSLTLPLFARLIHTLFPLSSRVHSDPPTSLFLFILSTSLYSPFPVLQAPALCLTN
jgi:hypothetical protein